MAHDFDLDVTFDDARGEPDLSAVPIDTLTAAIAELPDALRGVATGLLLEKRTMSDVSQDLGIRQGELVTRLHRATSAIATHLGL
jgi:DNA-directed RNA polymerase specialized sigma24 family protein